MRSLLVASVVVLIGCGSSTGGDADGGGGDGAPAVDGAVVPQVIAARRGITAAELGVLVNDDDPLSVAIAAYYVEQRAIPAANVVHLHLPSSTATSMSEADFAPLKAQVDAALSADVQALAITWTRPYAVGNMSVTSAFATGYTAIAGSTCTDAASRTPTPYLANPSSTHPFTDLHARPAMTIPATTIEEARALIDRGVASDDTWPTGTAYLMNTSDQIRSARCIVSTDYGWDNDCQQLLDVWDGEGSGIAASIVAADAITGQTDVMFYVQGLQRVADLATNTYRPGAVADHLTSFGGQIPVSGQMSAFEFLRAGATGSYGTVVEPCAYTQKFPDPSLLVPSYFGGATLVEAYWRSVQWPAEGIFIGEPLARPFGSGVRSTFEAATRTLTIETTTMVPGRSYRIEAADSADGPWTAVQTALTVPKYTRATFTIADATRPFYRLGE